MKKNEKQSHEFVWRSLLRLADRLSSAGVSDSALHNRLSISQLRVIGVIYERHPEGIMLKEVADELKLTPGAISQTVDTLVKENLVERTVSPKDRRAILLRPTDVGLTLKAEHSSKVECVMQSISSDIPEEEFKIFSSVLERLLEQIGKFPKQSK